MNSMNETAMYWQTLRNNRDAVMALQACQDEIFEVAALFTRTRGDSIVKLTPKGQSLHVRKARGALKAMRTFIESQMDNLDEAGKFHFSERKMAAVALYRAYIKACLALAYVDYWKDSHRFGRFAVLAQKVEYYADAVMGSNWEFFAPPIFFNPSEALLPRSEENLQLLIGYAGAAHGYAMALHGQLNFLPRRDVFTPVELSAEERHLEETVFECTVRSDIAIGCGQERALELHFDYTRDRLSREAAYRRPVYPDPQRLVGFQKTRGNRKRAKHKR
ncbi:MAG: hypothetical protein IPM93_31210 [Candidatus Obscuribacter sp.]|nr:hypothetical protein [Candidatus Obscuribacter sp.]